ncbi:hypothetical protein [Pelagibacterium limicola]|uniref:hypothetical protein n=1 Tax=Pelagibacterium limicola TaxID=2791022 RepID=UPI0018AFCE8B|nr:hypothetical protein [Pelagibacterium limicola]
MFEWIDAAGDAVMGGVIGVMGLVGLVDEAPSRYPLDAMMAGFTEECQLSGALEALWTSAVNGEALVLPDLGEHYFGDIQVRQDEEFREIRVPVEGEWMGHSVDHFALFAGNDNGIAVLSVRFDPTDTEVAATFAPLAQASAAKLDTDPENYTEVSTAFVSEGGLSQYYCDFST